MYKAWVKLHETPLYDVMYSYVIFGGTAEYVALYLKDIGHERWFYIYISALAAFSLVAYVRMKETKTNSLILED